MLPRESLQDFPPTPSTKLATNRTDYLHYDQLGSVIGMTNPTGVLAERRPDIIMVGEIRDEETAEIACRAALVGRMVVSTLHTNSPEGAVTRLTDLGVPEYIVKDVLRGVLGQRLEIVSETARRLSARLVSGSSPVRL